MNQCAVWDLVWQPDWIATDEPFMTRNQIAVRIDRLHNAAICAEIGERLRIALTRNPDPLPSHLLGLIKRFDSAECGNAAFKNSTEVEVR
jgi:hypothetical protein